MSNSGEKTERDKRLKEIDALIPEFKGALDDYSREIYRSLLMEKKRTSHVMVKNPNGALMIHTNKGCRIILG